MASTEQAEKSTETGGTKTLRYREALNEALREELERDESVFLMGEDIGVFNGAFKVTQGLLEDFGEKRVRDTPISENTIVGAGVGAAMLGLRPVVELMTVNFSLLAMDQLVNSAAHVFGKRRYETSDTSRNSLIIALLTGGEGWHNNHHHYQGSCRQGFFWWEVDPTWYVLKAMSWVGIVKDMKSPPRRVLYPEPEPERELEAA